MPLDAAEFCPPLEEEVCDPQKVMEHDVGWLVDEISETKVAWGEQLPVCPIRPGSHPMDIMVTAGRITESCPVTAQEVRSATF